MALLDFIGDKLKVLHKVKRVPDENAKEGFHFVSRDDKKGALYVKSGDEVHKIIDSTDFYDKDQADEILATESDRLQQIIDGVSSGAVRKTYATYAAMAADNDPIDGETGQALKYGQLVAVSNPANPGENAVYRYLKPGWDKVDQLGDLREYAKQADLEEYAKTGGSEKTVKEVETDLAQLAGEVQRIESNYAIANLGKDDITIRGNAVTFLKNPLLLNVETGHRVFLFPSAAYPLTINVTPGKILSVPISIFEQTQSGETLPANSTTEVDYASVRSDMIFLLGFPVDLNSGIHYGILTQYFNVQFDANSMELASGYTLEQGSITTSGQLTDRSDRIRTSFIEVGALSRIEMPAGYTCVVYYYDRYKNFLTSSGAAFLTTRNYFPKKGVFNVRIVFRKGDGVEIQPQTFGEKIYYTPLTAINKDDLYDGVEEVANISVEQGTLDTATGNELSNQTRIRTKHIATEYAIKVEVNNGYKINVFSFDTEKKYIGSTGYQAGVINNIATNGYIRIIVATTSDATITPDADTGLKLTYRPKFAPFGTSGIPTDGKEGDVLTPAGWEKGFAKTVEIDEKLDSIEENFTGIVGDYQTGTNAKINGIENFVSANLSNKVSNSDLVQSLSEYQKKSDPATSLVPSIVTPGSLSESVKQLIEASSGGTITNLPDDDDITSKDNLLKLKDSDVVRFRLKATSAANYEEMLRCLATGITIEIKDSIDLAHSDGSIRTVIVSGQTLKFVGKGQIKNCRLEGVVGIDAPRRKIFDNVYFHRWQIQGNNQTNKDSVFSIYLSHDTLWDVYNLKTKTLSAADMSAPVNPFECAFTKYKIGAFYTPVFENGNHVYKEGASVMLTFTTVAGKVRIPIRKDYVFTDAGGNILQSTYNVKTKSANYTDIDPVNLRVSRLFPPTLSRTAMFLNEIMPEWFGARANDNAIDNKTAFQTMHICPGTYNYAPSATYHLSGGIMVYGGIVMQANKATLKLLDNSESTCLYEIETRVRQSGITIYDIVMDGNKANNAIEQDGIYADFYAGQYPINGYSFDNTYWYNLDVRNFSGSGINCACPGTSHIYSSYMAYNNIDGIGWCVEHFTLNNCTAWGNGRHGAYASGNHWRIIGGAYAHNGAGDNIHCKGAFESQLIGCSVIDSGQFVAQAGGGYIASSQNVYGYVWVGEGQGTHALIGGHGINFGGCSNITILGVRINNQNANAINVAGGSKNIYVSNCQFNGSNMTKGNWEDIGGEDKANAYISNSTVGGSYVVTNKGREIKYFGTASNRADWNDIKNTLAGFSYGVHDVRDSLNALNRPSAASAHLCGTIRIADGASSTIGRVFIDMMDENCVRYYRHFVVDMATGAYSNDTSWKKLAPAPI